MTVVFVVVVVGVIIVSVAALLFILLVRALRGDRPSTVPGTAVATGNREAAWYPDPQGVARLRYWDGTAWTNHTD